MHTSEHQNQINAPCRSLLLLDSSVCRSLLTSVHITEHQNQINALSQLLQDTRRQFEEKERMREQELEREREAYRDKDIQRERARERERGRGGLGGVSVGREDAADITKKEGREKKTPSEERVDVEVYCYTFL